MRLNAAALVLVMAVGTPLAAHSLSHEGGMQAAQPTSNGDRKALIAAETEKLTALLRERRFEPLPEVFSRLLDAGEDVQVHAVHNHRFGFCRGTLTVRPHAVSFAPMEGEDGFTADRGSVAALATVEGQVPTIELRVLDTSRRTRSYTFHPLMYLRYQKSGSANNNIARSFVGAPEDYVAASRFNGVLVGLFSPRAASGAQALSALGATDWKKALEQRLEIQWPRAKLTFLGDNISQPGAPLLLLQPGVLADRDSHPTNEIVDGYLQRQSMSSQLGSSVNQAIDPDRIANRVTLPRYVPVFVTGARVSDEAVTLQVATRAQFITENIDRAAIARFVDGTSVRGDAFTKVDASIRKAALVFRFGPSLAQSSLDQIIDVIQRIIAPPDHPDAPQPGRVAVGMSREQVIRNLGKPKTIVTLDGGREILVYDNLKITLHDGKVSDVQ